MIDCIVRNYLSLSLCFVKYATRKYFHTKVAEVFTSGTQKLKRFSHQEQVTLAETMNFIAVLEK
jgi:hypothetical protein